MTFIIRSLQLLQFFTLIFSDQLSAQVVRWKTYTSVGSIRDIEVKSGVVWAATDGGVLQINIESGAVNKFTNTEGLSANDVIAVEIDKRGSVWFGLANGDLNRYFPSESRWEYFEDFKNQEINDIKAFGDSLYVALDIGVSLFLIHKEEVKETYRNFGLSSGNEVTKVSVRNIFIEGSDIWVSTDKGLARSNLNFSNLQAPASWTTYTLRNGLPTEFTKQVITFNDIPYVSTSSGLYQLINNNWQNAGFDSEILFLELIQNNSFLTSDKTLLALLNDGVYWLDPMSANWQKLNSTVGNIRALKVDDGDNLWIGIEDKGIAKYNYQTNDWNVTEINSPAKNSFVSLALDSRGRLWTASPSGGIQMLDGDTWTNYSTVNGLPSNDYRTILVDSQDRVWAGSWGGGLVALKEEQGKISVTKFDTTSNILVGYIGDPDFVLVPSITLDKFDNLWIANTQAINNRVLVAHTPDDQFMHFSTTQGIISNILYTLMVDQFGRVWIGTDKGVNVMEYEDGFTDVDFSQGLNTSEGLLSNTINALAEDDDGTVWIGTNAGLNIWFDGIVDEEFDTPVNAIGIDGINNKWIGTNNGITILKGHFDKVGDLTPGNSQLVQGKITSFAFNFTTGEVWIGTDRGLSKATTLFTAPKDDLSQLTGFPNPFIIDGSDKIFTITNLANNTNVAIFTSAGKLVKSFKASQDILGAQAYWNGTDADGKLVASGVYIYLAYTEDNVSATGKVAVVRR